MLLSLLSCCRDGSIERDRASTLSIHWLQWNLVDTRRRKD